MSHIKKRRMSLYLADRMRQLQQTRDPDAGYLDQFLVNASRRARLMHSVLKAKPEENILSAAISVYLSAIVTCWETFFRDLFLRIARSDLSFLRQVIEEAGLSHEGVSLGVLPDFVGATFNFQLLSDVEKAFSPMFHGHLLDAIGSLELSPVSTAGRVGKLQLSRLMPDWRETLDRTYEERHRITHDANYAPIADISYVQKAELVFVLFPQIMALKVVMDRGGSPIIVNQDSIPVIVTVNDLISDDWVIVE